MAFQSKVNHASLSRLESTHLDERLIDISGFEVDVLELELMLEPRSHLPVSSSVLLLSD